MNGLAAMNDVWRRGELFECLCNSSFFYYLKLRKDWLITEMLMEIYFGESFDGVEVLDRS